MNLFDAISGLLMVISRPHKRRQHSWDHPRKTRLSMKKVLKCARSTLYVWSGLNNIFPNGKAERGAGKGGGKRKKETEKEKRKGTRKKNFKNKIIKSVKLAEL